MAATAEAPSPPAPEVAPVDLGGRCEIIPGSPVPELDSPGARAYVARRMRDRRMDLFALVAGDEVPARIEALPAFRGLEHPSVLQVVDWGVVDWTPENRRRFVILFERPGGRRLMENLDDVREPIADDLIVRSILPALHSVLRDVAIRGVTCGAVRPTNLFLKEASSTMLVLGDCVSTPGGYGQPVLVETIERGMAQPSGRGPGTISDDLYALGVTLLILAAGGNPLRGLDDEAILRLKMDKGTYPALASSLRLPSTLTEPLRGLLADDTKQRWSVSDLDMWMLGRRLSPKHAQLPRRAARPLEFDREEYWHCRSLARAFARRPALAAPMIGNGELDKWLRRALNDEERAEQVQSAADSAGSSGRTATLEDRMVARVVTSLDPPAPIRYRGVSVMPDGIGTALAEAVTVGQVQPIAELILGQLPMFWVSCQTDFRAEHVPLVQLFDLQRALLEHTVPGYGIERVLYELNPACPCMSPVVRDRHALTLQELMLALDHAGSRQTRGRDPVDRHIVAFIAANHKKINDRLLPALVAGGDSGRRLVASLQLLADVQSRFGPAKLSDLCGWMVALMEPGYKRFRHRPTREKLKQDATRVARDGSLERLLRLVDDPEAIRRDEKGFYQAMRQHEVLTKQIERLRASIRAKKQGPATDGRQVAAIVSSVMAMAGLLLTVFAMAVQ